MPGSRGDQSLDEILRYHLKIYNNYDLHNDWSLQQGKGEVLNGKYYRQGIFYYLKYFIDCFKEINTLSKHNYIRKKKEIIICIPVC